MEGDISNNAFKRLSSKINFTRGAFCSLLILAKECVDASLAVGAHALVDSVSVAVNTFTKEAGKVLEHISFGRSSLSQ